MMIRPNPHTQARINTHTERKPEERMSDHMLIAFKMAVAAISSPC